jgi:hypothetical protein
MLRSTPITLPAEDHLYFSTYSEHMKIEGKLWVCKIELKQCLLSLTEGGGAL